MRVTTWAHILFAVGMAGLGVLSLLSGDFAMNWQPVPMWVAGRSYLAYASGALLLAAGLGMLMKRTSPASSLVLAVYVSLWLLVLQLPRVVANPVNEGVWLGFCENTLLVAGSWTLHLGPALREGRLRLDFAPGDIPLRVARYAFAGALPIIGLSHFVYVTTTASMTPAWLPDRMAIAYFTGSCHIAAGICILLSILPRLAATMEAIMLSMFVLLLHVPGVASAPGSRLQWTMLFVATALTACAWAVAGSLLEAPGKPGAPT